MTKRECAGLKILKNTLEPNRMEVIRSMVDRGPYGQIEDWDGEILIEISERCFMGYDAIKLVAEALASNDLYRSIIVSEWDIKRDGLKLHMVPLEWEEIDVDSHLRIQ